MMLIFIESNQDLCAVYSFINYACMDLQTLYGKMCAPTAPASHQHELVNAKLEPQPSKRNTDQTDCAEL